MTYNTVLEAFPLDTSKTFAGISSSIVEDLGPLRRGKVRDVIDLGDHLAIVATDRVSAFDRVLGLVPFHGQILNQLSVWWFRQLKSVVASHYVKMPDPNVVIVKKCEPLPVEVVVRGYLTGTTSTSIWTRYEAGDRHIYGIDFPDGMNKNDPLPSPIITPTTKADSGHDQLLTESQIVSQGLVESTLWDRVRSTAVALFEKGRKIAEAAGLGLVDTKYEFGIDSDGVLTLIDEVHTPDSSRFWRLSTLEQRLQDGFEPENLDKEIVRLDYAARGYRGDGTPPPFSFELAHRAAEAYKQVFEMLTGKPLKPARYPFEPRIVGVVQREAARLRFECRG